MAPRSQDLSLSKTRQLILSEAVWSLQFHAFCLAVPIARSKEKTSGRTVTVWDVGICFAIAYAERLLCLMR